MRARAARKDGGETKSAQVLLIRSAEKTKIHKKMKERGLQIEKKSIPCREDFLVLYFSNYPSVVCKCVCVSM